MIKPSTNQGENKMTDKERDIAFDNIKANVLDMVLGPSKHEAEMDEVEKRAIDFKFGNPACKSFMEDVRITPKMNNDMAGFAKYNSEMAKSSGYLTR